jgi:lipoprotein-anchoring transpeptidase ErfK/SrfK
MALAGVLAVAAPVSAHLAGARAATVPTAMAAAALAAPVEVVRDRPHPPEQAAARDVAPRPTPHLLVRAEPGITARARPDGDARSVGAVAHVSRFYRAPLVLWVEEVVRRGDRSWGRIELPYVFPRRDGWILLDGLARDTTWVTVTVDLSEHELVVERRGEVVVRAPGATGAPVSPTPPGNYVVTDRVPFAAGSYLGSFAFGISGIQPRLPPGWSGGDQLAIHGTNSPWSIGRSVSAGCVRVSEGTLDRLLPLLRQGTPVLIVR